MTLDSALVVQRLTPDECRALVPELPSGSTGDYWVVRTTDPATGWMLSVATHASPGSHRLSLGGFRIAPRDRAEALGYQNDREALGLAIGMEGKIQWSRLIRCGGPQGLAHIDRLVGGKCVLLPGPGARVGEPNDRALLDFAAAALNAFEQEFGASPVTGQDLGHGTLSDGVTPSLAYLHQRYRGSVLADTSKPTGEGNTRLLLGALRALQIKPQDATIGLIGLGNIGDHVMRRLAAYGSRLVAIEADAGRRAAAEALGVRCFAPDDKREMLQLPMHALVVNARGGSLDSATIALIERNTTLRVICGCENLAMPNPADADRLRAAHKVWFPTEFGGMMGYLTAVEEYLCAMAGVPFAVETLFDAAERLEEAGAAITTRWLETDFDASFAEVASAVFA